MSEQVSNLVPPERAAAPPRRWTLHGLNNGVIFWLTCRLVAVLPRRMSYGIGHVCTWLAWRLMRDTREAVADNLRPIFPDENDRQLQRRALTTLRAYAQDVVDFLRALAASPEEAREIFEAREQDRALFRDLLARGRGIILVTGH